MGSHLSTAPLAAGWRQGGRKRRWTRAGAVRGGPGRQGHTGAMSTLGGQQAAALGQAWDQRGRGLKCSAEDGGFYAQLV